MFYKTQRTDSSEELSIHGARLKDRGQPTPSGHSSCPRSHRGPPAELLQAQLSGLSNSRCGSGVLSWRQVAGADRAEEGCPALAPHSQASQALHVWHAGLEEGISSHHPVMAQGQRPEEPT